METLYPQLIHTLSTAFPLLITAGVIGLYIYVYKKISRDFPEKKQLDTLSSEIVELSGELGDLRDRFSRFQKREGMRAAREAKQTEKDVVAQAQELIAQGGHEAPQQGQGKLALYSHLRKQ